MISIYQSQAKVNPDGRTIMELELLLPKGMDEVALEVVGGVLYQGR
jgi:hypothetical protein